MTPEKMYYIAAHVGYRTYQGYLAGGPTAAEAVTAARKQAEGLIGNLIGPKGIPILVREPGEHVYRDRGLVTARWTHIVFLEGDPTNPTNDRASLCVIQFTDEQELPEIDVTAEEWKLSLGWDL